MKTWMLLTISVLVLAAATSQASPFENLPPSRVVSVDRIELRIAVKTAPNEETRLLQITSETRFLKNGKYATSEEVDAGDIIKGQIHRRGDGIYEAVRLIIVKTPSVAFRE